ncbi:MAG: fumarylacetoacetate hydrolase family protein [Anaerolineales bacterium]|nr:fumarylacetoacetate hydrolase family protein [Anaerolineales bacterium]
MQIIRFMSPDNIVHYGWVYGNNAGYIEGNPFGVFRRAEATQPIEELKLLPPVSPSKIICVGRNYQAHAEEHNAPVPETPLLFLKPNSSLLNHAGDIVLPKLSNRVEHEAELAVVIGKKGRCIHYDDAMSHVFGYTIANDVTARDLQEKDGQWTRAKGFDTFCPLGPWIETEFNPADAVITCHVNGELRQMASTRDMVFTVQQLITFISTIMTLEVGDLILTGTPSGVGSLKDQDWVEVTLEGIGKLRNSVIAEI